jgi:hypothetical protein
MVFIKRHLTAPLCFGTPCACAELCIVIRQKTYENLFPAKYTHINNVIGTVNYMFTKMNDCKGRYTYNTSGTKVTDIKGPASKGPASTEPGYEKPGGERSGTLKVRTPKVRPQNI